MNHAKNQINVYTVTRGDERMNLTEEKHLQKNPAGGLSLELFGPTIEYLTSPNDAQNFCILKGTVPPGGSIPLHSHPDTEDFYIISGSLEVLRSDTQSHTWITAKAGDLVHVPGNTPHAWRNSWAKPAVALIVTTKKMARFFQEVGRGVSSDPQAPTLEELTRFAEVSARYGYWNVTPEENARVGIRLSF
jgi:quercetin dioxygenase-like cupin family protein